MSILVREIEYNGRKEHMLYYPGMTKQEAQHLADQINGGMLAKRDPLSVDEIANMWIASTTDVGNSTIHDYMLFAPEIERSHGIGGE